MGKHQKRKPSARNLLLGRLLKVRSFKGQSADAIRERFRLVTGLVNDVLKGSLSESTAKRLAREISDRIREGGPLAPGPRIDPVRIQGALTAFFGSKSVKVRSAVGSAPIPRVFKDGRPTGSHRRGHHTNTQAGVRRLRRGSGV